MAKAINPERLKFWQERVEKSNGTSLFIPEVLKGEYDKLAVLRDELEKKNLALTEEATTFQNGMNNWWFKVQKYLKENGMPDVFNKNLGEDAAALKEGLGVINVTEPQR